jgi:predicted ATPase/DNA-binding CsgD family transcriptional regulator
MVMVQPNNLPVQRIPLIGRVRELAAARDLLLRDEVGLLTLTGAGGTGKTRLALQLAWDVLGEFEDGVYFVNLAPLTDPSLVAFTVAQTLGIREHGTYSVVEGLKTFLRDKRMLLLLDNFEHVIGAAPVIAELLSACQGLKVLTTSREGLRIHDEHELPVPPLDVPDASTVLDSAQLMEWDAVRLFVDRARAVRLDFQLTSGDAPAVAEICRILDGLPLAIELAAARVRLLPPRAMLRKLNSGARASSGRLELLTAGGRDAPARHRTLFDAIAWSFNLLDAGEKRLFYSMSVFQGGCSLEAIERVCDDANLATGRRQESAVFEDLDSLCNKNLVWQREGPTGEPRFGMLETIREFATTRLETSDEAEALRCRHAGYYLALTEKATRERGQPRHGAWDEMLRQLETEHDNLRAALEWSLAGGNLETGIRLAGELWQFWLDRAYLTEGRRWLKRSMQAAASIPAVALGSQAWCAYGAGVFALLQGAGHEAIELYSGALALFRQLGDRRGVAWTSNDLAQVVSDDYERARRLLEESVALKRQLGDLKDVAIGLNSIGELARLWDDYELAEASYREALRLWREIDEPEFVPVALMNLGQVAVHRRDFAQAMAYFEECLQLLYGDSFGTGEVLVALGGLAVEVNQFRKAARLFGAAGPLFEMAHTVRATQGHGPILAGPDQKVYEQHLAKARSQLDEAVWTVEWEAGRGMPLEDVIKLALQPVPEASPRSTAPGRSPFPAELTKREVEVLRLVTQGLTNPQIADQLCLSIHTVEAHLHSVFGKLDVRTRAAAARFAVEHSLI